MEIKFKDVKIRERFKFLESDFREYTKVGHSISGGSGGYEHNSTYNEDGLFKCTWANSNSLVYVCRGWRWRVKTFYMRFTFWVREKKCDHKDIELEGHAPCSREHGGDDQFNRYWYSAGSEWCKSCGAIRYYDWTDRGKEVSSWQIPK